MTVEPGQAVSEESSLTITLRYFDGCPSWEIALRRVNECLEQLGMEAEIVLERVETPEQAAKSAFLGSPSILIDGRDRFPTSNATPGLSCRLYATESGSQRSPTVSQMIDALRAAQRERNHR